MFEITDRMLLMHQDQALLYRGIGKFRLEDLEGACADWHRAVELGNELAQKLIDEICGE